MLSIVIGIVLVAIGIAVGVLLGKRNLDHARVVSEVPSYDCAQVGAHGQDAPGMRIAVSGSATALPSGALRSPLTDRECVWYRLTVSERTRETRTDSKGVRSTSESESVVSSEISPDPILLTDATGSVLVDTDKASIDHPVETFDRLESTQSTGASLTIGAVTLGSDSGVVGIRRREEIIPVGAPLYVVGGAYDRGGEPAIAAPRQGPFIVSTLSAGELESSVRRKSLLWFAAGVGLIVAGVALAVSSILG